MEYISTRGNAPALGFSDVLLTGLAEDGGLYLPSAWPQFDAADIRAMRGLSYADMATQVMLPFVKDDIDEVTFSAIVRDTYASFGHDAVAPLKQIDHNAWLLELFHGPTIAFKDYALQLLGRLFDHVLAERGKRITVVGATSGDTGSAAIEACRDRERVDIFIMHPHNRTSEVQRRQMTTVLSSNVHNIAVEGNFDDCQDIVKAMFNDPDCRRDLNLSAVNSINWARIMAQIVYYFHAGISLGAPDRPITFAVPTGNFGNVFAGYAAKQMGLPIDQLIIGSNSNDILTRFFETGSMTTEKVVPTVSPSMDIQVSSNFERYLFELFDRDSSDLTTAMNAFRKTGEMAVSPERWSLSRELFDARRLDDDGTKAAIAALYKATGELIDPHTAVGVVAGSAARRRPDIPLVCLACAHPAKFPDTVEAATGVHPPLPPHLSDLFDREEKMTVIGAGMQAVQQFVRANSRVTS